MKITVEFQSKPGQPDENFRFGVDLLLSVAYRGKYKIINSVSTNEVSYDSIEKSVCEFIGITPEELQIKTRKREVVEGRQICHFLSRNNGLGSLAGIAERFGKKDHATCLHSIKTVKDLLNTDKAYREKYKSFIESFETCP